MPYLIAIFFSLLLITLYLFVKDRRTLMLGVFSFLTLGCGMVWMLFANQDMNTVGGQIAMFILVLVVMCILLFPVGIIIVLIRNGIQLIKKEGFSFRNLFSLLLGIFLLVLPMIVNHYAVAFKENLFLMCVLSVATSIFTYLVVVVASYTMAGFLNFFHMPRRHLDYVVVLGSGLINDQVTPLLAGRIEKGMKIAKKNPDCKLIMSGGKGNDEWVAESVAMKRYAIARGFEEERILVEDASRNTEENLLYSTRLMKQDAKFAIVTNYYHLFRALLIARHQGVDCIGYGSKTKFYFSLNAYIRELIGYLYLRRDFHIKAMSVIALLAVVSRLLIFTTFQA